MEIDLTCPHCSADYQSDNPPRMLHCGHTFCHTCLTKLISSLEQKPSIICPDDQQSMILQGSLQQLPKNIALMKLIEGRKKNSSNISSSSLKDASFDVSKITKEEQCQEDQVAQELISQINRASRKDSYLLGGSNSQPQLTTCITQKPSKISQGKTQKEEVELCLLHQRPIEVVCMKDYQRLCSKCALFGQHKGHQFKGVQEIEQQNKQYYQEIITIFEQKAGLFQRLANKSVQKDLVELLNVKTTSLRRQIHDKFKKIAEDLSKAEKTICKKLDQSSMSIEKHIQSFHQLDQHTCHSYDCWQVRTLEIIKESQKPSNDGHLNFYLKKNQLLKEGKQLREQLEKAQKMSSSHTVQIIEDFTIVFHDTDYQTILNNLVEVLDLNKNEQKKNISHKLKQNEATLANCQFEQIKKIPILSRQQSEQSLLDPCEYENESIASSTVGSKMFEQCILTSREEQKHHLKENTSRPLIKKKHLTVQGVKDKQKIPAKQFLPNALTKDTIKRKMRALKLPQKYEKIIEGIISDSLQTIDLTNAQLGDGPVLQILQLAKQSTKVKCIKLIRNKLSDEGVAKMLPYFGSVVSVNISQNQLTEQTLNLIMENKSSLPLLQTLVLSQTKIIQRKSKGVIQRLKKLNVCVSV